MRIALVTDSYAPARTSAAIQMRDLAQELAARGHFTSVLVPESNLGGEWELTRDGATTVLRIRAKRTKDVGKLRRAFAEFLLAYYMTKGLSRSPLAQEHWDGVVWYSPSIFLAPFVKRLKKTSSCRAYLILRDIFPDWAADTGVMRKGVAYWILKFVQRRQNSVADIIGVQSAGNLRHLAAWKKRTGNRVEVLHNWLTTGQYKAPSHLFDASRLRGRRLFVYTGNMGLAQDLGFILELADKLKANPGLGFLFVGRGTEVPALRERAARMHLTNTEFYDEIEPDTVRGLLERCHIGIVALHPGHTTQNIPGKFLSYLHAGLPVLARLNPGNDLVDLISSEGIGLTYTGSSIEEFAETAFALLSLQADFPNMAARARKLGESFSVERAADQVLEGLAGAN